MPEWVVTLRSGRRIDLEAERYECSGGLHVFERSDGTKVDHPLNAVCVQRREGHLLEQVWPER